ncbi:glycosyltransferase family protein [Limnochorda pilosa]|uniref:Uncharacterized protein n=1 Tax=Limnochorda pilosa TaxID=1555112 RepID=A0A0K2SPX6_LIMPI|nr:hypothetical protein [Limnochorda pilosa]BAS28889.1 hypothetical protein LIP_3060 [Limnochorda pilosa]
MREVLVTVNSPGEVATWLEPVARELLHRLGDARLTVMIPPCTFASGAEAGVVRDLLGGPAGVRVYEPGQVVAFLLSRRRPPGYRPARQGVVLFLGGDMVYAAWLARRLGYRALAYTEGRVRWTGVFERFLLPDGRALDRARRRLGSKIDRLSERLEVVGDLMTDAARSRLAPGEVRARLRLEPGEQVLLLLPGSRSAELRFLMPLYLEALRRLAITPPPAGMEAAPVRAVFTLSPFVDATAAAALARAAWAGGARGARARETGDWEPLDLPGARRLALGRLGPEGTRTQAARPVRVELVQGASRELMAAADMALTLPGSNTAEMAAFGLPMLVVLPLQRPEEIPLEGLAGLVGGLPAVGPALKRRAVYRVERATPFVALPNRRAGRRLVPELRGEVGPEALAGELAAWLDDGPRRAGVRHALEALRGEPGAARRVADRVLSMLGGAPDGALDAAGEREGSTEVAP